MIHSKKQIKQTSTHSGIYVFTAEELISILSGYIDGSPGEIELYSTHEYSKGASKLGTLIIKKDWSGNHE